MSPPPTSSSRELPFEGFGELIERPLAAADPRSFERIRRLFVDEPESRTTRPFSYLLKRMTGKALDEAAARRHWRNILEHKADMELKLGRIVAVQAVAVDYFVGRESGYAPETGGSSYRDLDPERNARARPDWADRLYGQGAYMERLKEETLRAKRYHHALSALLLNVDGFHTINERFSSNVGDELLSLIVTIIRRTIRTVDFVFRVSGDRFIVILPNTNLREAGELATRIKQTVERRCRRLPNLGGSRISVGLSVAQSETEEGAGDLVRRLETELQTAALRRGDSEERPQTGGSGHSLR